MYQLTTLPVSVDPSTRLALANLRAHLLVQDDYSTEAINGVIVHVAREGCIDSDTPYFYPQDLAAAEAAYVRGFEEVPYDSPEWGHLDDDEPLSADAPDAAYATGDAYWREMMAAGITPLPALPPIAGGSLEAQPLPDDRRDFESWLSSLDADYPPVDQAEPPHTADNLNRYSPASLLAFRRAAWGF